MSYRLKLMVTITLLIALAFGIGGTWMITTSFHASLETETQASLDSFESIQNTLLLLSAMGDQTNFESLTRALEQMLDQNMGNWQALCLKNNEKIIFRDGNFIPENHGLPTPLQNQCSYIPIADQYGHGLLVMGIIALAENRLELLVRFDLSRVYQMRETQQQIYHVIFLVVLGFGLISAGVLSLTLTKQLRKLTKTARQISEGDLSKRSAIMSSDEFGQLSKDFDAMTDKLQEQMNRLEADMERQERFMGAFAHELKTPMTSIIGFADLLRQGNMDEISRLEIAEYIYTEGHRLERLSFKLLELLLLKKDDLQMKSVWLPDFVSVVEKALAPVLKEKDICLICNAESKYAVMEPDLVKSLLYNLIDNASKAMEDKGVVKVVATTREDRCQFQVIDNGRGMEQSELTKITEAFYRVDKARSRNQGGAGLGLSLCKQIVELHNGNLEFESEPGKGTIVTVILHGKKEEKHE